MTSSSSHSPLFQKHLLADRYRLLKKIGEGSAGEVFLAEDLQEGGAKIALKRAHRKLSDSMRIESLRNEFDYLRRFQHPHVARVRDFGIVDQRAHFTCDWIEGEDLFQACQGQNLNTQFELLLQLLRALHFMHSHGILHLDLKPSNVLVARPNSSQDLSLKLIDFSLAQNMRAASEGRDFFGTPPYAAPEVIQGGSPCPSSDLYSFGVLCCKVLTGHLPFEGNQLGEILQKQLYEKPRIAAFLSPAVPEEFRGVLGKLLRRDPKERHASALELLRAMNESLGEQFSLQARGQSPSLLANSPHSFWKDEIDRIQGAWQAGRKGILLFGRQGSGKTRLLQQLKQELQLSGESALYFGEAEKLRAFLARQAPDKALLLLDFTPKARETPSLLSSLREQGLRFAWAAERKIPGSFELNIPMPALSSARLAPFLREHVARSGGQAALRPLERAIHGRASELADYLEALFEEGKLSWEAPSWKIHSLEAPAKVLKGFKTRWQARLRKASRLLAASPGPQDLALLAQILQTEPAQLLERLEARAFSSLKILREGPLLKIEVPRAAGLKKRSHLSWKALEREMSELYEEGRFAEAEGLRQASWGKAALSSIPASCRLGAARNFAALGNVVSALQMLPKQESLMLRERGLRQEVLSRIAWLRGESEKALSSLQESRQAYSKRKDFKGLARVCNLEALLLKKAGQFRFAEEKMGEAIAWARRAKDPYLEGLAWMNLATFFHDRGSYGEAFAHYEKALRLSERSGHPLLACILLHNRVNLAQQLGKAREAHQESLRWYELALISSYPEQQAAALNYLALFDAEKGNAVRQERRLREAARLTEGSSSPLLIQSLLNLSHALEEQGAHFAALLDAQRALRLSRQGRHREHECRSQLLLGKILRAQKRPELERAGEALQAALQIAEAHSLGNLLWEIHLEFGILSKKARRNQEAARSFQRALAELEAFKRSIPAAFQKSFLRDRKEERIRAEMIST